MSTVVQVVQHMRPGGIETMALDLSAFSQPHEKSIIVSLEGDRESAMQNWPRLKDVEDKIFFLNKKPGLQPLLIFRLVGIFIKHKAHAIHTHHIGPLLYAGLAARIARIKHLIHTEHDAWHLNNLRRRKLQKRLISIIRPTLVADAKAVADKMSEFLNLDNIHIINNGIDTERFTPGDKSTARSKLGLPQNVKIIGCSGRLEKVKGQKTLIYALSKLPDSVHLAMAGAGSYESELRRIINAYNLNKRVHILGRIDEMPDFYRALDIFCLPSMNEGYPLSPLEAQSCNVPAIVTDVGASAETLCPYSGELIPANEPDKMAHILNKKLKIKQTKTPTPRLFVQQKGDVRHMAHAYAMLRPMLKI